MRAARHLLILICALFAPAVAFAADPSPLPSTVEAAPSEAPVFSGPVPAPDSRMQQLMEAGMQRVATEMRASKMQLRRDVLAQLSLPQRSFVASVIGALAISPAGDAVAASRQIDAGLSPAQRQAIFAAAAADASRRQAIFAKMADVSAELGSHVLAGMHGPPGAAVPQPIGSGMPQALPPLQSHVSYNSGAAMATTVFAAPQEVSAGALLLQILSAPDVPSYRPMPMILSPR